MTNNTFFCVVPIDLHYNKSWVESWLLRGLDKEFYMDLLFILRVFGDEVVMGHVYLQRRGCVIDQQYYYFVLINHSTRKALCRVLAAARIP